MSGNLKYNVLWVDDNPTNDKNFVIGYQLIAEQYGIKLIHFPNWEEAEVSLKKQFDEFSAIVLDAECDMTSTSAQKEKDKFIPKVVTRLTSIFNERKRVIPWYILSAGTMTNFDYAIDVALDSHSPYEEEWGPMLYLKDVPDDDSKNLKNLFQNINLIARDQSDNVVIYRHQDVFKYLGDNKLIAKFARNELRKMLKALYFPNEEAHAIKFEGNPLRKVMEYVFRAALKYGLLPIECIERDNQINLLESNRFMSGLNTKHSNLRYGKPGSLKDGRGGDTIFPEYLGHITRAIIEFGSVDSHTNDDFQYTINDKDLELTEDEKELFFSYVLQVCHVVKWFGAFVDDHPDIAKNKAMIKKVEQATEQTSKKKEKFKIQDKSTEPVKTESPKPTPEPVKITSKDIIGGSGNILNGGKALYVQVKAKCKIADELKPTVAIGEKIRVEAVEPNNGGDSADYPFIITKISTDI